MISTCYETIPAPALLSLANVDLQCSTFMADISNSDVLNLCRDDGLDCVWIMQKDLKEVIPPCLVTKTCAITELVCLAQHIYPSVSRPRPQTL